jgi:hypothetical protein
MFLRSMPIVFVVFLILVSPATLRGQSAAVSPNCVDGCAPATCQQGAQSAPMASWWANSYVGKFCRNVARDTKRNNCWYEPFIGADRLAVRAPFVQMVANGWQRQNTLGDHHFDAETGKLNRAGELKVRQILLEGLPQHRDLWVYRAERANETAARVTSVREFAGRTVRDGNVPQVFETDIPVEGWPAQVVDLVETKSLTKMPDPVLPPMQGSGQQGQQ